MKWTQEKRDELADYIFKNEIAGEAFELGGNFIVWAVLGMNINGGKADVTVYKAIKKANKVHLYVNDNSIDYRNVKHRFVYTVDELKEFFEKYE